VGLLSPVLLLADNGELPVQMDETSSPVITDIVFQGNKTTRPRTMLQEMVLSVGDPVDAEKIELCRQAIMDINLFKSVIIEEQINESGVILQITVDEKFYILPLPTLSRSNEGDISYGAYIKWYNMFGKNYTFKLSGKVKKFHDGDSDSRKYVAYDLIMPRLYSGPWQLQLFGDISKERLYAPDSLDSSYMKDSWYTGFELMRWIHLEGPSHGWFVKGRGTLLHEEYELDSGIDGFYDDGFRPIVSVGGGYKKVHDHLFSRTGKEFGYTLAQESIVTLVEKIFEGTFPLPERKFLNVNIPPIASDQCKGLKSTRLGNKHYGFHAEVHYNPRGMEYYWIGLPKLEWMETTGHTTDFEAINDGYVSVSPVQLDMTSHDDIKSLERWL